MTSKTSKMSIVAAAFAAGMLVQPATALANTAPTVRTSPSAAAMDHFKALADMTPMITADPTKATFRRIVFKRVTFRRIRV